jgi:hypothetical protein
MLDLVFIRHPRARSGLASARLIGDGVKLEGGLDRLRRGLIEEPRLPVGFLDAAAGEIEPALVLLDADELAAQLQQQATPVVPEPMNGSQMTSPGRVKSATSSRISGTGFSVGCSPCRPVLTQCV